MQSIPSALGLAEGGELCAGEVEMGAGEVEMCAGGIEMGSGGVEVRAGEVEISSGWVLLMDEIGRGLGTELSDFTLPQSLDCGLRFGQLSLYTHYNLSVAHLRRLMMSCFRILEYARLINRTSHINYKMIM